MPTTVDALRNAVPRAVIAAPFPLHRLMSNRYALLTFRGRRTGTEYTTPIAYARRGDEILLTTDSPWYRNLSDRAPVRLRLAGSDVAGTADVVADPARAAAVLRTLVDAVPGYHRPAGLAASAGRVSDAEILRSVTTDRKAIIIRLDR